MLTYFFNHNTYKDKIKSVSNLRILSFFIWKFFLGFVFYFFLLNFTKNYYISYYLLHGIKFHFHFTDYLKIVSLFLILDFFKIIVFQNYEEIVTNSEQTIRIILEPKHQTIFFFLNSFIISILLKILEKDTNRKDFKLGKYEIHMIAYG
jgi:hypothetical protein